VEDVDYVAADLSEGLAAQLLRGVSTVVHCAAETAGGWESHKKNSIHTTENVLREAAAAGVTRVIHVSSLAALSRQDTDPLSETTPLEKGRSFGSYIWGKAESERRATQLAAELSLELCVVRPGPLVDYRRVEPPGRLGRRVGNLFVAVGSPSDRLEVIDVSLASSVIRVLLNEAAPWPKALNLVQPVPPTKAELLQLLRSGNPQLRVVWVPWFLLWPLSQFAKAAQRLVRPSRPPIDLASVFRTRRCDTTGLATFVREHDLSTLTHLDISPPVEPAQG
jgi:nucleoside-diphosphate-sugar epimerase